MTATRRGEDSHELLRVALGMKTAVDVRLQI